ncbi:hypothetical protein GH733_000496 [Mirounga leonina]|nr:hypothetical protein GH733_000496 [Mirounga leonina]
MGGCEGRWQAGRSHAYFSYTFHRPGEFHQWETQEKSVGEKKLRSRVIFLKIGNITKELQFLLNFSKKSCLLKSSDKKFGEKYQLSGYSHKHYSYYYILSSLSEGWSAPLHLPDFLTIRSLSSSSTSEHRGVEDKPQDQDSICSPTWTLEEGRKRGYGSTFVLASRYGIQWDRINQKRKKKTKNMCLPNESMNMYILTALVYPYRKLLLNLELCMALQHPKQSNVTIMQEKTCIAATSTVIFASSTRTICIPPLDSLLIRLHGPFSSQVLTEPCAGCPTHSSEQSHHYYNVIDDKLEGRGGGVPVLSSPRGRIRRRCPGRCSFSQDYSSGTPCRVQSKSLAELGNRIDRQQFEETVRTLNNLYAEAEKLGGQSYLKGCLACLTAHAIFLYVETHYEKVLKKVSKCIQEQNEKIYAPQGLLLTDPTERGLKTSNNLNECSRPDDCRELAVQGRRPWHKNALGLAIWITLDKNAKAKGHHTLSKNFISFTVALVDTTEERQAHPFERTQQKGLPEVYHLGVSGISSLKCALSFLKRSPASSLHNNVTQSSTFVNTIVTSPGDREFLGIRKVTVCEPRLMQETILWYEDKFFYSSGMALPMSAGFQMSLVNKGTGKELESKRKDQVREVLSFPLCLSQTYCIASDLQLQVALCHYISWKSPRVLLQLVFRLRKSQLLALDQFPLESMAGSISYQEETFAHGYGDISLSIRALSAVSDKNHLWTTSCPPPPPQLRAFLAVGSESVTTSIQLPSPVVHLSPWFCGQQVYLWLAKRQTGWLPNQRGHLTLKRSNSCRMNFLVLFLTILGFTRGLRAAMMPSNRWLPPLQAAPRKRGEGSLHVFAAPPTPPPSVEVQFVPDAVSYVFCQINVQSTGLLLTTMDLNFCSQARKTKRAQEVGMNTRVKPSPSEGIYHSAHIIAPDTVGGGHSSDVLVLYPPLLKDSWKLMHHTFPVSKFTEYPPELKFQVHANAITCELGPLLAAQGQCIVGLVPLPVRCAVNEHNTVLHQGLGADQFVVGCFVDNTNNPCFSRTTLRA